MSAKVKYKNGFIGTVSDKVADILEKKKLAEIIEVIDEKQPELDLNSTGQDKPKRVRK